uniref:Uncharacterized protein n=1 Tax=Tanacetum cinerariifolium TaxID=118510 RepID=A0A699ISW5_TANCI|nr:hypothetical protein [Tanacetum cinerariifolium]
MMSLPLDSFAGCVLDFTQNMMGMAQIRYRVGHQCDEGFYLMAHISILTSIMCYIKLIFVCTNPYLSVVSKTVKDNVGLRRMEEIDMKLYYDAWRGLCVRKYALSLWPLLEANRASCLFGGTFSIRMLKKAQEKDKIGSKLDKNRKRGEARESLKQLQ